MHSYQASNSCALSHNRSFLPLHIQYKKIIVHLAEGSPAQGSSRVRATASSSNFAKGKAGPSQDVVRCTRSSRENTPHSNCSEETLQNNILLVLVLSAAKQAVVMKCSVFLVEAPLFHYVCRELLPTVLKRQFINEVRSKVVRPFVLKCPRKKSCTVLFSTHLAETWNWN